MRGIVVCLTFLSLSYGLHVLRIPLNKHYYHHLQGTNANNDEILDLMREVEQLLQSAVSKPSNEPGDALDQNRIERRPVQQIGSGMSQAEETALEPTVELPTLTADRFAPAIFSKSTTPSLVITGNGKVGKRVKARAMLNKTLFDIKVLDSQEVTALTDAQLRTMSSGIKSIVIADYPEITEEQGLFGRVRYVEKVSLLDGQVIKRLLNTVVAAHAESRPDNKDAPAVKVVYLGKACKPPRSAASMLFGDTTLLEDEVVLQCKQRGLPYSIVKVGRIIEQNERIPEGVSYRGADAAVSAGATRVNPVVITLAGGIQHDECTRVDAAVEGLLRAVNQPGQNCTFSLLSNPLMPANHSRAPTDEDWADAFLVLDGPELLRISLIHASAASAVQRLHSLAFSIERNGVATVGDAVTKELITPVAATRFTNGAQVAFKPVVSRSAASFKHDKTATKDRPENTVPSAGSIEGSADAAESRVKKESSARSAGRAVLEGGLEILVEEEPYARVRVRRCLMGKQTVVKEESERVLLQAVQRCVALLEREAQFHESSSTV